MGNEVQARVMADQVADAAVAKFAQMYGQPTEPQKMEIPAGLKLAGGVVTALITAAVISLCFWMVTTLSDLQQTVTRIDERQQLTGGATAQRLDKIEERLTQLEQSKREKAE
jgi:hypothetical protein